MFKPDKITKKVLYVGEIIIVCLICLLLMLNLSSVFTKPFVVVFIYLFFCISSVLIVVIFKKRIFTGHIAGRIALTVSIGLLIRLLVIYFLNLTSKGDYAVYLSVAKQIKNGDLSNKLYFGIFPHSLNYPIFMSFFYRILGELTWLPRVINLFFGVLEVGLGTYILEKCMNSRAGVIGGLAVALNPSIIIFTLLSGGEPIYSSLIISAIFLLLAGINSKKPILLIASGIMCGVGDFFRPSGIILIVAAVLIIILYSTVNVKDKIIQSLLIALPFAITVFATGFITASVSGYSKPSYSFGWNLYIGANEQTNGVWNENDAELFNSIKNESQDPSKVQEYFFKLGVDRYKEMGLKSIAHFKRKLGVWLDENYISNVVTDWQTEYTRFKSGDMKQTYFLIVLPYNLIVVLGAIAALIFLSLDKKAPLILKIMGFYMIGTIMLFMVLETAARYKGAYYAALSLLAVYGYWKIYLCIKEKGCNIKRLFADNTKEN